MISPACEKLETSTWSSNRICHAADARQVRNSAFNWYAKSYGRHMSVVRVFETVRWPIEGALARSDDDVTRLVVGAATDGVVHSRRNRPS